MNVVTCKCWRDGGIGLAQNPKLAITKFLYVEKADLKANKVDGERELQTK